MNKTERIIIGIVILVLLGGVFGILAWRGSRVPAPAPADPNQNTLANFKNDLLQPAFINQLKALDINGNLPVTVSNDETHGEGRNPFE